MKQQQYQFDKSELYELYWGKDLSVAEIADEYDCSETLILKAMNKMGIPRTKAPIDTFLFYMTDGRKENLYELYWGEGLTTVELEDRLDRNHRVISDRLNELGIPTRNRTRNTYIYKMTYERKDNLYDLHWRQGLNKDEIADKFNLSKHKIARDLKKFGIPARRTDTDPDRHVGKRRLTKDKMYEYHWSKSMSLKEMAEEFSVSSTYIRERMVDLGVPRHGLGRASSYVNSMRKSDQNKTNQLIPEKKEKVLDRDNHKCQDCDSESNLHIHHKTHKADGGGDNMDNLITLCTRCHVKRHDDPRTKELIRRGPVMAEDEEKITREDLIEQAEAVKGAVEASMYYPVAHGEAEKLKQMIEEYEGD